MKVKRQLFIILLMVLLMVSAIYVVDISLMEEGKGAMASLEDVEKVEPLSTEQGMFLRSEEALEYANMPEESSRSLNEYYKNRAYHGAPPVIPHPLISEKGIGDKACLQCHENGGYTELFEAFAPVTPHANYINCRQCHVPEKTDKLFKATNWEKMQGPEHKVQALQGSPPVIPHTLKMRENCLSCHGGPSAPKEIRVSHPERINCRQCHAQVELLSEELEEWTRPSQTNNAVINEK